MTARSVVLDTNVVLDWLLFDHPAGRALGSAVQSGELHWVATASMRQEFIHVLGRGGFDRWQPDVSALQSRWARHCTELPEPTAVGAVARFRCTDPDDQMFIDLARSQGCGSLLLSRDRAVLKLAHALSQHGISVCTPAAWVARRV